MLIRQLSTLAKIPKLSKIPAKYKRFVIKEAKQALTDYLHSTRSVPYAYAESISNYSCVALSNIISKVPFSPATFSQSLHRYLIYHPINEFEFFYESIGIDYHDLPGILQPNKFFFSQDHTALHAAYQLSAFGFPWNKLGLLYREESSVFNNPPEDLKSRLAVLKQCGFGNTSVTGICLAFPFVLSADFGGEVAALFADLKKVFLDYDLRSCVDENADAWYHVCRKIRMFYDLGCEKGTLGELMGKSKHVFVDYSEDLLLKKVHYFCKFCVRKQDVALLLLQKPEILDFDLETPAVSIGGLLKHFGLGAEEMASVARMYAHVLGRNKMANLPNAMRSMNLHEWFFKKVKDGNAQLLATCAISDSDEDLDRQFKERLERIRASRTPHHTMNKLNFMHGIGYGENALTLKVLAHVHGTANELQERFDFLIRAGIGFSDLCLMVRTVPKILNQKPETLQLKLNYLLQDMKISLDYLKRFPAFLNFHLDKRIKPRHRFHVWLVENGMCTHEYSIASIVATSEKNFVARLGKIHPDAPKHWSKFCSAPPHDGCE